MYSFSLHFTDEQKTQHIIIKDASKEKSYDGFSSGEQKRIDLAMLFTFQDILRVQNGINIHLAFYDEILDTSIDEIGRKKVLEILILFSVDIKMKNIL